jgi:hypothetical protein
VHPGRRPSQGGAPALTNRISTYNVESRWRPRS